MAAKQLWVVAGGNGAGKSTFFQHFLAPRGLPFVNADQIARSLNPQHPETLGYDAARLAHHLRRELLRQGTSFCAETVFSHPSKLDFIAEAKALGYEVILVFIHLSMDGLNQARVAQRVSEGGHDVPADKIIARIPRTLNLVRQALPMADRVRIYDNSSEEKPFRPVAELVQGALTQATDPMPDWARTLLADHLTDGER